MVIPKKIEKLLDKRAEIAIELMDLNAKLDQWLKSKGADFTDTDIRDSVTTGCMIYVEPYTANSNIKEYIKNKL